MHSPFIPLGSGEVLPWETHSSLSVLHQLKLFNFPVPNGIILIDPKVNEAGLDLEILSELQSEIRQRELKPDLLITAFGYGEDGFVFARSCTEDSLASFFNEVVQKFSNFGHADFLILEQTQGLARGRAFSQAGYGDDWVEFQLENTETTMPITKISIEKLSLGEARLQGDFRGRIQDLLRSIRRALGEDNWTVGWTDTSELIFLTSIEKITSPLAIPETFVRLPKWENVVEAAQILEGSLIESASKKLFQYFRNWAPELSDRRSFVIWKDKQIKFNTSLIQDFLRSFGLSTRPLKMLISDVSNPVFPFNSVRFWRNMPRLFRFLNDLRLGPGIAHRLSKKFVDFGTSPDKSFSELFQEWQTVYIESSHAVYRLSLLFLISSYSFYRLEFSPSFKKKGQSAELALKSSTSKALGQIQQAIRMKALGWYSRGILSSDDSIWNLTKDQILAMEADLK